MFVTLNPSSCMYGLFFITVASQSAKIKRKKSPAIRGWSLNPRFFVYI